MAALNLRHLAGLLLFEAITGFSVQKENQGLLKSLNKYIAVIAFGEISS